MCHTCGLTNPAHMLYVLYVLYCVCLFERINLKIDRQIDRILMTCVIVSEILLLPVIWLPSWIYVAIRILSLCGLAS